MALIVKKTQFKNTSVDVENVYVRIQFMAMPNGKNVGSILQSYQSKVDYENRKTIETEVPNNIQFELDTETQVQDVATVHQVVKSKLEELGFEVTIEL